jgi:alpha-L-fucosidase
MTLIVAQNTNTLTIMTNIPQSAKETLKTQLKRRLEELAYWQHEEAKDIKIIAESYGFSELVELANEKI